MSTNKPAAAGKSDRPKRVFIVGSRRSGTTWTMRLVSQHPSVVGCQQSGLFHALDPLSEFWHHDRRFGRWIHPAAAMPGPVGGKQSRPGRSLREVLDQAQYTEFARPIVEYVLDRIASTHPNPQAIVEQTPENMRMAREILQLLPDAYFLHVIRDPRSVVASQRHAAVTWGTPGDFSTDPVAVAQEWCSDVKIGRDIAGYTSRYFEITYETLRKDGPVQLQRIFDWLELPSDPDLCARAVQACSIERLRSEPGAPKGFFRKGEAHGWRAELKPGQIKQIEYIAGDMMAALGYARSFPALNGKPWQFRLREWTAGVVDRAQRFGPRVGLGRLLRFLPALQRLVRQRQAARQSSPRT